MLFQHLHSCLLDKKGDLSHAQVGRQLRMSEEAVSQAVSRLRERFRKVFDEELAKLVGSPTDTEAEIAAKVEAEERFLFAALRT